MFEELTGVAAAIAKAALELKAQRLLRVDDEHKLGVCNVCGCDLPLKIFAPLSHVLAHTTQEQMKEFPETCWIKTKDQTPNQ